MMDFFALGLFRLFCFFSGFSSGIASGSLCSCSMRSPTVSFSGAETTVFGIIDFFAAILHFRLRFCRAGDLFAADLVHKVAYGVFGCGKIHVRDKSFS